MWGIIGYIKDNQIIDPTPVTKEDLDEACEWLDKHAKDIFKVSS